MLNIIDNGYEVFSSLVLGRGIDVDRLVSDQELPRNKVMGGLALRDGVIVDELERGSLLHAMKVSMKEYGFEVTDLGLPGEQQERIRNITGLE